MTERTASIQRNTLETGVLNLSQFIGLFFTLFLFQMGGWWASGR